MITHPLHLFGPMAEDVAAFIARLGVPVTTEPATTPNATQMYCHGDSSDSPATIVPNLLTTRTLAPQGTLASWALVRDPNSLYAVRILAGAPSGPRGAGCAGLFTILRELGYHPTLTLGAIVPPHPEPDATPSVAPEAIRHATAVPASMTSARKNDTWGHNSWGYDECLRASFGFWQMSADLRDVWLLSPESRRIMVNIPDGSGPLHNMIWHRGSATTPEVMTSFADAAEPVIRRAWLQGLAHWGIPEQLHLAHELTTIDPGHIGGRFAPTDLPGAIKGALQHISRRAMRIDSTVILAIVRLIERDPAFGEALMAQVEPGARQGLLEKAADAYLAALPHAVEIEPPHPSRSTMGAYLQRTPLRSIRHFGRLSGLELPVAEGGEPDCLLSDTNPVEGIARLTELAEMNRGTRWRSDHYGRPVEMIISAWGRSISEAGDFAMADWLQSFKGSVGFLGRVANGVLTWPTLTPATITGITRARHLSKQVKADPTTEELVARIPDEQIPAEWRAMVLDSAKKGPHFGR